MDVFSARGASDSEEERREAEEAVYQQIYYQTYHSMPDSVPITETLILHGPSLPQNRADSKKIVRQLSRLEEEKKGYSEWLKLGDVNKNDNSDDGSIVEIGRIGWVTNADIKERGETSKTGIRKKKTMEYCEFPRKVGDCIVISESDGEKVEPNGKTKGKVNYNNRKDISNNGGNILKSKGDKKVNTENPAIQKGKIEEIVILSESEDNMSLISSVSGMLGSEDCITLYSDSSSSSDSDLVIIDEHFTGKTQRGASTPPEKPSEDESINDCNAEEEDPVKISRVVGRHQEILEAPIKPKSPLFTSTSRSNPKLMRYFTMAQTGSGSMKCEVCFCLGHTRNDCPEAQKSPVCVLCGIEGHTCYECSGKLCFNCDRPGHQSRHCISPAQKPHFNCQRCTMFGHLIEMCPDQWRQYHLTTEGTELVTAKKPILNREKMFCYNCGAKGHLGHMCTEPVMTLPRGEKVSLRPMPLVCQYKKLRYPEPKDYRPGTSKNQELIQDIEEEGSGLSSDDSPDEGLHIKSKSKVEKFHLPSFYQTKKGKKEIRKLVKKSKNANIFNQSENSNPPSQSHHISNKSSSFQTLTIGLSGYNHGNIVRTVQVGQKENMFKESKISEPVETSLQDGNFNQMVGETKRPKKNKKKNKKFVSGEKGVDETVGAKKEKRKQKRKKKFVPGENKVDEFIGFSHTMDDIFQPLTIKPEAKSNRKRKKQKNGRRNVKGKFSRAQTDLPQTDVPNCQRGPVTRKRKQLNRGKNKKQGLQNTKRQYIKFE